MDSKIWKAAQRNHFPYNVKLEWIVGVPLVLPLGFLLIHMTVVHPDVAFLKTILQTLGVSVLGYLLSDKMIEAFKESLEKKGLFGRDLNKAGIQKDKKPV